MQQDIFGMQSLCLNWCSTLCNSVLGPSTLQITTKYPRYISVSKRFSNATGKQINSGADSLFSFAVSKHMWYPLTETADEANGCIRSLHILFGVPRTFPTNSSLIVLEKIVMALARQKQLISAHKGLDCHSDGLVSSLIFLCKWRQVLSSTVSSHWIYATASFGFCNPLS